MLGMLNDNVAAAITPMKITDATILPCTGGGGDRGNMETWRRRRRRRRRRRKRACYGAGFRDVDVKLQPAHLANVHSIVKINRVGAIHWRVT
jgi:hypothetical protein